MLMTTPLLPTAKIPAAESPSTPYGDKHVTRLSPAVPREAVHKRQINCNGFVREDGLYDIEAELTDHKTYAFPSDFRGIVTLEDILEEIVGDIDDEHDIDLAGLTPQADGSWLVDGNVTIRDLNRTLGWQLPDEDASTVAGLVLFESRTIPNPGQEFRFHDIRFRIVKRKGNRLTRLRLWAK